MNELTLAGVKDVLNKLSQSDLFALTATITQGLFKPKETSREGESTLTTIPIPNTILYYRSSRSNIKILSRSIKHPKTKSNYQRSIIHLPVG